VLRSWSDCISQGPAIHQYDVIACTMTSPHASIPASTRGKWQFLFIIPQNMHFETNKPDLTPLTPRLCSNACVGPCACQHACIHVFMLTSVILYILTCVPSSRSCGAQHTVHIQCSTSVTVMSVVMYPYKDTRPSLKRGVYRAVHLREHKVRPAIGENACSCRHAIVEEPLLFNSNRAIVTQSIIHSLMLRPTNSGAPFNSIKCSPLFVVAAPCASITDPPLRPI
jgi:hypothetical protein